jgi:hypothetical protein
MTIDNTTWRDLSDLLTAEQIAELEYCEREQIPPGLADEQHRVNCARMMARDNLIQQLCADIASPVDATGEPDVWQEWGDGYGRMYSVSSRDVGPMTVDVCGVQFDDGRTETSISILAGEVEQMSAAQARQLAAALVAAADEMDGWVQGEGGTGGRAHSCGVGVRSIA